ncbi:uncharacterized protein LAESUDRAFT_815572 [Laetiporus sulphureus 93-53]|uniref:Aminotransferase class I/classII domain-containing protein n=1 Tax=Laetiporus sulphureus 93-53 TaxID=1314785 RepID=A0A165C033_9APHY|nr:uncharacterized protein LAESUDRAFT_815572 [Laetiporus sulphureus 93-53]KZT01959.1 hypothetical protein LAESUDRAFT_815572 [Laetiporus sulphureus 93-53]
MRHCPLLGSTYNAHTCCLYEPTSGPAAFARPNCISVSDVGMAVTGVSETGADILYGNVSRGGLGIMSFRSDVVNAVEGPSSVLPVMAVPTLELVKVLILPASLSPYPEPIPKESCMPFPPVFSISSSSSSTRMGSTVTTGSNPAFRKQPSHFLLKPATLGMALAHPALVQILMNTKAPYNISAPTVSLALLALSPSAVAAMNAKREFCDGAGAREEREAAGQCARNRIYKTAAEEEGVVVRYRGGELGCEGCLRITVGSAEENVIALRKLEELLKKL